MSYCSFASRAATMMVPSDNDRALHGLGPGPVGQHRSTGPGATALHAMGRIDADAARHTVRAMVSITTATDGAAPSIAGIGKIAPSAAAGGGGPPARPKRRAIVVPTYSCSGGMDTKVSAVVATRSARPDSSGSRRRQFNHLARHARPPDLHGLLSADECEREIRRLNDGIKRSRARAVDFALLAAAPLTLAPLIPWAARHSRRRQRLIEEGAREFNKRMEMDGRGLRMTWNRAKAAGGGESFLAIEEADGGGGQGGKKFD